MVIHVITRLPMGGAMQLVYDITTRMLASGQDVLILTGLSDEKTGISAPNNRVLEQVRAANVPVEVCPFLHARISPWSDLRALFWLSRRLRRHRSAIVHIHSSKAGILARLACRLVGVKRVVFHVHGWSYSGAQGLTRRLFFWLERAFYWITTDYVFVSHHDMVGFVRLGGNPGIESKGHVIYPGAGFLTADKQKAYRHILRQRLGYSDADHVVGSIGRLDYQKNPQSFISIASRYAKAEATTRFLWIGDGCDRTEVELLIETFGLADRFTLLGYVDDVEPYFAVFDTFVITSRYEGLPLAVIKALSCGTPVVGFRVNGMNDLGGQFRSVRTVAPGDEAGFVQALSAARSMLTSERNVLDDEARFVRENLNRDRMYDAVTDLYASMRRDAPGAA